VLNSFVIAMMNAGMIIVGPLEGTFGTVGVTALDLENEAALNQASALGERTANVVL
jgi:hypothetical protein